MQNTLITFFSRVFSSFGLRLLLISETSCPILRHTDMQPIINKDDTPGPPPEDMIHPFQIFSTLLKLSSLCPKSQQIINKIKVSWYEPTMSPNSCIPSQSPPFSKANLCTALRPHHLLSPGSLAPSIHYSSDSSLLLPSSSLSANIQVTSIYKKNCFSISVTPGTILPSFHILLCQQLSPCSMASTLPTDHSMPSRGQIRMSKDSWLEERIEEKHKTGRKGGKLLASWGYGAALLPGLGAVTT